MVYDCFLYLDEPELLEIRLHELDAVVDRFVLVEATQTFSGVPKPLYFAQSRSRWRRFAHKITHVVVDDIDSATDLRELPFYQEAARTNPEFRAMMDKSAAAWSRQAHQRNAIMRGLAGCQPDDVILVSDLDEIPRASHLPRLASLKTTAVFEQRLYYYFLNCQLDSPWLGTKAIRYRDLASTPPQELRAAKADEVIHDGGWHFSYLGGLEKIRRKIESISQQVLNTEEIKDRKSLLFNIENNLDIYGRGLSYALVDVDASYPEHVRRHRFRYRKLIRRERAVSPNTVRLRQEVTRLRKENEMLRKRLPPEDT